MDCGPTCLRMIAKYYGKNISIETLRKHSELNRDGVSIFAITHAAEKIGFKSIGCKVTFDQLVNDAPTPCLIHWRNNHYVVLLNNPKKNRITIADPSQGIIKYEKKEFLENWISFKDNELERGIALFLEPTSIFHDQIEDKNQGLEWHHITKHLFKYKKQLFQLSLGVLLVSLFQLVFPFLTQSIIDTGISSHNLNFIQLILIAQATLFFAQTIVEFIRGRINLFISSNVNLSILSDFWIKLMQLPLNFFETKNISDILQRISDHKRIEYFITGISLQTIFSLFNLIIFSFVLFIYDAKIFLIFILGSIMYLLWIRLFLGLRRVLDHKNFSLSSKETSTSLQLLYGMQEIKLNNAEYIKRWFWEGLQAEIFKLNHKILTVNQYQTTGAFFINQGKNILITYLVAKAVLNGQLTLGSMLAIQYIIAQLNAPVDQLVGFSQELQKVKISLERLNDIHKLDSEEHLGSNFNSYVSDSSSINIKNLSFSYPGNDFSLKDISLVIPEGKVTAIVGMSGSGKTTLLKLLQKFYDNYKGDIKIGENNLKNISPHYWRSITGSVMQEAFIFSDTIENNVAVGDENPNYNALVKACKIANILDFVEALPLGFNTKIGAEGNGISQGQKQRILIARAVYKNPRFIFFDEATNALDSNNEKDIIQNLKYFFKDKTVVVVAHRLSTVKDAHNIIVLDKGSIIESGNHTELTQKKGRYYELVKNQLELGQ